PRRRLRFSLRTLFVLVTVIACWLGWQVHVVQHRKAMLRQIEASGGYAFGNQDWGWGHPGKDHILRWGNEDASPSAIRSLLGDIHAENIGFDRPMTGADRQAIAAFPEASIYAIP